jgi:anti-sigma B factor antagonist
MAMTTAPVTPEGVGNFNVESLVVDGQAVLRLSGDLDMGSAELFAEAARRVHAEGFPCLVLDLSALDFVDSSGLSEFVLAFKRQQEIGGEVVLRAPTAQVRRVLDIVGLSEVLPIAEATPGCD